MKKLLVFSVIVILSLILLTQGVYAVSCETFDGSNISGQNYSVWASPVKSYLSVTDDGRLMRVQYLPSDGRVLIEYYDSSYNIVLRKYIEKELPLFGGFYDGGDAFYILTGQKNPNEKENTEVFRITKYDKSWKRLSSAGLFGANTTLPFDAGSARFSKSGKFLIIRTCHEMYTNPEDGLNHQANVTIQLDTEKMVITDSFTDVMNKNYGYVSHSFNQFIKIDGDNIVALDHGDAFPRSIVLIKYKTKVSSGKFIPSYYNTCQAVDMFPIAGQLGDNYTNCSVGGFEISDSTYISAISSVEQGSSSRVRNIYISVLGKTSDKPDIIKLTSYTSDSSIPSTPHLVKISDNSFLVLWEKDSKVCCAQIDKYGSLKGSVSAFSGALSDCVPVVYGSKVIWYVWNENEITFYEADLNDMGKVKTFTRNRSHSFSVVSSSGDKVNLLCDKCSAAKTGRIPSDFSLWWETDNEGYFSSVPESIYHPGEEIRLWVRYTSADYNDYEVVSSDADIIKVSYDSYGGATIHTVSDGTATVTVKSAYNPEIESSYTITSSHSWQEKITPATCTQNGKTVKNCSACGESKTEIISALGHNMSDYTVTKEPTCTAQGKRVATCSRCDEEVSEAIAKLAHDENVTVKAVAATCTKSGKTEGKKCSMCGKVTLQQETIPALGHDMSDYKVTKEPTCTAQGKKVATCSCCDEEVSEAIAKLAHDENVTVKAVTATCTKSGKTEGKKCSMCGKVTVEQETIPALGHDMSDYKVTKQPTCTAQGKKVATCSRCDEEVSEAIAKVAHDEKVTVKAVSATCTKSGKTEGKKCSMCGKVTVEQETIPALGHDMSDYKVTKQPTCTAQGKKVATCLRCDEEVSEAIAKIAHDENVTVKAVTATCTKSGKTEGKKCSMCGKVTVEQETIPALGHDMSDFKVTKEPTCTAQGEESANCTRCDKKETRTIENLGHSYSEYEVTKAPTCTAMGEKTAYCSRCNQTVKEDIARLPHEEVIIEATEPTCTKNGKTQGKKCERCGRVLLEQITVEKLGHSMKETVVTKATAENHGEISKQCSRCVEGETQRVYMIKTVKPAKDRYAYNGKTPKVSVKVIDSQKNVLKEGVDYTVSVGSAKKVGTHTAKVIFKGKYEGSAKVSFDIVPGKTAKITASESTSYIKLTWSKVSGATGYRVYQYDSKMKSYKLLTSIKGKNTYTVKNLKSGTSYKFAVKAYTKLSDGSVYWGTSVKAEFGTKPAKVSLTAKTGTKSATLTWSKLSGISGYQVYCATSKNGDYKKLKSTTALSYKKTGLTKGKTYYFKVRAYKKVSGKTVYGVFSDIKSVKVK